jgi:hypothetical protein
MLGVRPERNGIAGIHVSITTGNTASALDWNLLISP